MYSARSKETYKENWVGIKIVVLLNLQVLFSSLSNCSRILECKVQMHTSPPSQWEPAGEEKWANLLDRGILSISAPRRWGQGSKNGKILSNCDCAKLWQTIAIYVETLVLHRDWDKSISYLKFCYLHMWLSSKIVNFCRFCVIDDLHQAVAVNQIPVVENHLPLSVGPVNIRNLKFNMT